MGMGRVQLRRRVQYIHARHLGRRAAAGERRQVRVRVPHASGDKRLRFHGVRKEVTGVVRAEWSSANDGALTNPPRKSLAPGRGRPSSSMRSGVSPDSPPFIALDDDGSMKGYLIWRSTTPTHAL